MNTCSISARTKGMTGLDWFEFCLKNNRPCPTLINYPCFLSLSFMKLISQLCVGAEPVDKFHCKVIRGTVKNKNILRNYKKPPLRLRLRLSVSRDWCHTNVLVLDELALQKRGSAGPMHHILFDRTSENRGGKKKQRSQQRWKSVWVLPFRSTPQS